MDVYMIRANSLYGRENGIDEAFIRERMAPILNTANLPVALDLGGATWKNAGRKNGTLDQELEVIAALRAAAIQIRCVSLQSVLSKPLFDKDTGKRIQYSIVSIPWTNGIRMCWTISGSSSNVFQGLELA